MSFITDEFIITNTTEPISFILKEGVSNFFAELNKYISDNGDPGILTYANEMTLASLFLCGNVRRNQDITGVQEYGIDCVKNGKTFRGRPDIFMKSDENALWIESKFQRDIVSLTSNHWDIDSWLLWDNQEILPQLKSYYDAEKILTNPSYTKYYLVSLCFKLIKENKNNHLGLVQNKLRAEVNKKKYTPQWYYQVAFEDSTSDHRNGLEVYGTFIEENVKPILE